MANNLYPLIFKPGIKRDGTAFQSDYCTDGRWLRFQRGFAKKIGGMKAIRDLLDTEVSNIVILPTEDADGSMNMYLGVSNGVLKYNITQDFNLIRPVIVVYNQDDARNVIWKSTVIIQGNNTKKIVFIGEHSRNNINTNVDSILIAGNLVNQNDGNAFDLNNIQHTPILSGASGILYAEPFLFVYGSNGLIQWSAETNALDFRNVNDRTYKVSNDKVVDARQVRGGINTPTIICWTLSSVVKLINTGGSGAILNFNKDVLSESSSILSSRCVVEYDGVFFWPGTNRFFHYNGVVQELSNTMNLNYFYNNLDILNRQLVFGVKNTQYGEIWWFYPEKGQDPRNVVNTRAIIYNIRDNAWYDTAISRSAGVYSEAFGFMATYGKSLTANLNKTLYRHEYETFTGNDDDIGETVVNLFGEYEINPITTTFTTPTISWAAFNPMKQLTGVDRLMQLITIEPDFVSLPANNDMVVVINSRQYAQNFPDTSPQYRVGGVITIPHDPLLDKIDTAYQGRHLTLTFTTTNNFEMGHVMLLLGIGDGR